MAVSSDIYSNGDARGCYKETNLNFDSQQSRLHTAGAHSTRENQETFVQNGYHDGCGPSYVCPSQCHWPSSSNTDHSCSSQWCGPLSDLTLPSAGPDNMGKSKPSNLRPTNSTLVTPVTSSSTWGKPWTSGSMDFVTTQAETISEDLDEDDDSKSDCMSCAESCSSHCGETGHGSICCDAEECVDPENCTDACESHDPCADNCPGSEPCVDEDCEAARTPCMDEACLAQAPPAPPAPPARREEAAAAQALTSFHDQADDVGFGTDTSFLDGLNFGEDHGFMEGHGGMDFEPSNFSGFGNHMDGFPQANPFVNDQEAAQSQSLEFTAEVYAHILQYHDPCHANHGHAQHVRPCIADHPLFSGHSCPLQMAPDQSPHGLTNSAPDCNFTITNAPEFAHHLRSHHEPLLSQLSSWSNSMAGTNFQTFQAGSHSCDQTFYANMHHCSPDLMNQCFFGTNHSGVAQAHQHPTPGSSATVPSLMNTPHAAQESAATSPCTEFFQSGDYGLPEVKPKNLHAPEVKPLVKPKGQGRSLGPDDAFRCYWEDHKTGQPCLQNFEDSDALDAHCKAAHVKDLPKQGPGFSCLWQGCKRTHDSFSTRAKLNRHLQTHTGFKPMKCPHCGLRLSAKQALDQHIRTHTGEHPYECKFGCGQRFKQHSALTMHHRVHTKEKPLSCHICGAKFTESSNLSKHMRTHSIKGHFDCDLCDKNFHRLDQLRRHLNTNHKDQPEAAQGNIERAKDWKKKINRERRANMGAASGSSLEPLTETLTESSDTALGDLDPDMDDGL